VESFANNGRCPKALCLNESAGWLRKNKGNTRTKPSSRLAENSLYDRLTKGASECIWRCYCSDGSAGF
jgi:hypothetical protein